MRGRGETFWLFLCGVALAAGFYGAVWHAGPGPLYDFFYHRGPMQPLITLFFCFGSALVAAGLLRLRTEARALDRLTPLVAAPNIGRDEALAILGRIPAALRRSVAGQLHFELLEGYVRGDDVTQMAERAARRGLESFSRGDGGLTAVRQVLPMLGLVGAVVGLSAGMGDFARMSQAAGSLDSLRDTLREFARQLSTAFDTTLAALGFGLLLWTGDLAIQRRAERLCADVARSLRALAGRLQRPAPQEDDTRRVVQEHVAEVGRAVIGQIEDVGRASISHLARATDEMTEALRQRLQSGISEGVRAWSAEWRTELAQASREILGHVAEERDQFAADQERCIAEISRSAREVIGPLTERLDALERALARPRPFRIHIEGDHENGYDNGHVVNRNHDREDSHERVGH